MRVRDHTPGEIRYWAYYLHFPDGNTWVKSIPFVHPLSFELKNTSFGKIPGIARKILKEGEAHWKDQNGVTHRVVVEQASRPTKWGTKTLDKLKELKS